MRASRITISCSGAPLPCGVNSSPRRRVHRLLLRYAAVVIAALASSLCVGAFPRPVSVNERSPMCVPSGAALSCTIVKSVQVALAAVLSDPNPILTSTLSTATARNHRDRRCTVFLIRKGKRPCTAEPS